MDTASWKICAKIHTGYIQFIFERGLIMAINHEELYKMVKNLPEDAKKSAYDYIKYLSFRHDRPDWDEIMNLEPEDIPLSEEEKRQLKNNSEFVSWEDASHELNISTDTKS